VFKHFFRRFYHRKLILFIFTDYYLKKNYNGRNSIVKKEENFSERTTKNFAWKFLTVS